MKANDNGNHATYSYISFEDQELLVGDAARSRAAANHANTVFHIKQLIGRTFSDPLVQQLVKNLPFKVINKSDKPYIQVQYQGETKEFTPEELCAKILLKMKCIAEEYLGTPVANAVITG